MLRHQGRPVTSGREQLRGAPVGRAALGFWQLAVGHLAEQIMDEAGRAGRAAAHQAGRLSPLKQPVQRIRRAVQHPGQVTGADIGPPDRHGGQHVTDRLVQLPELRPDQPVQAGGMQIEFEPGLDGVRPEFGQGPGVRVAAQEFTREQRIAGRRFQDAAKLRTRPPAGPVEHQALDHHPVHRRQPQPQLRLPQEHSQLLPDRKRPGADQHDQRQALARPHQPAQQRERSRIEVMGIVGAHHHRTLGAQFVDPGERRLTRILAIAPGAEELPGAGERIIAPVVIARQVEDLRGTGPGGSQDLPDQDGLADARRALEDHARPRGRTPLGDVEDQIGYGPRHAGAIARQ